MDTPSIDAIVHTPTEILFTAPQSPSRFEDGIEQPLVKLKGRKKLMASLHRQFSSPSLVRLGRSHNGGYSGSSRGSMSCVSLASSPYNPSHIQYMSDVSTRYSTAPTSVTETPAPGTPLPAVIGRARARTLGRDTPASVGLPLEVQRMGTPVAMQQVEGDYFSRPVTIATPKKKRRANFNFWADLPSELRMEVLSYLNPKQIVRCSSVSKAWHQMCFDGQLWSNLDTAGYYHDIPAHSLVKIVASAGPFVRDLNLRGCVQLRERWQSPELSNACTNLENFSLEGCIIDRSSIHCFLLQNSRLVHINLTGLSNADNATMMIIGQHCPKVEHLNITWCQRVTTQGLRHVIKNCHNLKDLRAGEIKGWEDQEFMLSLHRRNTLERLVLTNCDTLTDESFAVLIQGIDSPWDYINDRPMVAPRQLKHLDLTRCRRLTDDGIKKLANNVPYLEGLQLSKNIHLTDAALLPLIPTLPNLTHLDLEELHQLTDAALQNIATSPCRATLKHLNISYCENLGDVGMLPILKKCIQLSSVEMDNTKISDLTLIEAADAVKARNWATTSWVDGRRRPTVGMRIVAYDCTNVTWTGIREILNRNTQAYKLTLPLPSRSNLPISPPLSPVSASSSSSSLESAIVRPQTPLDMLPTPPQTPAPADRQLYTNQTIYPPQIIALKCFYNWQPTVEEHTKRCLRGNFAAAARLEKKWAEWMMLNEEAGVAGGRRRRRRAREAQMLHEDEGSMPDAAEGAGGGEGVGRRRRARSGPAAAGAGCVVM